MSGRIGQVLLDGVPVGEIRETESGSEFRYLPSWLENKEARPVSLRLPLDEEVHSWQGGLHPFFENLIPEGWVLEIAVRKLKIPASDSFGLLLATCRDCIGAVEIMPFSK